MVTLNREFWSQLQIPRLSLLSKEGERVPHPPSLLRIIDIFTTPCLCSGWPKLELWRLITYNSPDHPPQTKGLVPQTEGYMAGKVFWLHRRGAEEANLSPHNYPLDHLLSQAEENQPNKKAWKLRAPTIGLTIQVNINLSLLSLWLQI